MMAWREGRDGPPPATQGQASLSLPPPFPLTSAFQSSQQPRLRLAGGGAGAREEWHGGGGQEAGRAEFVHGGGQTCMTEGEEAADCRHRGPHFGGEGRTFWQTRSGESLEGRNVMNTNSVQFGAWDLRILAKRCVRCGAWAHNCFKFPGQNTEHIQTPEFGFDNSKLAIPSPAQAQFIHPNTGYVFSYK